MSRLARKTLRAARSLAGRSVRILLRPSLVRRLAARAKQSDTVRRIAIPLLIRFPRLRSGLARLRVLSRSAPSGDIRHPDWPAPLPAEYLNMPASERRVLLDLARSGEPPSHP